LFSTHCAIAYFARPAPIAWAQQFMLPPPLVLRGHDKHRTISQSIWTGSWPVFPALSFPTFHVARRGARRKLFTEPGDNALYRDLLAKRCGKNAVPCWANDPPRDNTRGSRLIRRPE
jgi:hypothetical protein